MKNKLLLLAPGIAALVLTTVSCRSAAAFPPQAGVQEQAPPPPSPAYAGAPAPPPEGPPPPPRRGRRPGPPPPPAACGPEAPPFTAAANAQLPATTVRGSIRQFNYGPEGEVAGFVLTNGTQVNLPPGFGEQIAESAKIKSEVTVAGYERQSAAGRKLLDAITVTAGGQTFAVPAGPAGARDATPPAPPPPAGGPDAGPPQS